MASRKNNGHGKDSGRNAKHSAAAHCTQIGAASVALTSTLALVLPASAAPMGDPAPGTRHLEQTRVVKTENKSSAAQAHSPRTPLQSANTERIVREVRKYMEKAGAGKPGAPAAHPDTDAVKQQPAQRTSAPAQLPPAPRRTRRHALVRPLSSGSETPSPQQNNPAGAAPAPGAGTQPSPAVTGVQGTSAAPAAPTASNTPAASNAPAAPDSQSSNPGGQKPNTAPAQPSAASGTSAAQPAPAQHTSPGAAPAPNAGTRPQPAPGSQTPAESAPPAAPTAPTAPTLPSLPDSGKNSQVIVPNTENQTAQTKEEANEQVQTDKKPEDTYNLKILYTISGEPNKQLVQPYELTIDRQKLESLANQSEYIELPKPAGFHPAVTHTGNYTYFVRNEQGEFVPDNGTNGDAVRYLRLDRQLIEEYCIGKDEKTGVHYGELNINYAPRVTKYYVRHLLQDEDNRNGFHDSGRGTKIIEITDTDASGHPVKKKIHVTEHLGTVGSFIYAQSVEIPGYEPEKNNVGSPLSDKADDGDHKLVLNMRYYRKSHDVTYDTAGGTDITAQRVYYDTVIPPVKDPQRRGYVFKGWELVDSAGRKIKDLPAPAQPGSYESQSTFKMPDEDVHFRAVWEANKTTSYTVNVWVQKPDLVDPAHPDSLINYDFVGMVKRENVKTGSDVQLDSMSDAGVSVPGAQDGQHVTENPLLGLTEDELTGSGGLIKNFNWLGDDPVSELHPQAGADSFTRYFLINKKLTKKLNSELRSGAAEKKNRLDPNDLNNRLDLVYDRKTYELIFFADKASTTLDYNPFIYTEDENGTLTAYCYAAAGTGCAESLEDGQDTVEWKGKTIPLNRNGYRFKARYGQILSRWPSTSFLGGIPDGKGFLGWRIWDKNNKSYHFSYRDTPPYRLLGNGSVGFVGLGFANPAWKIKDTPEGQGHAPGPDQIVMYADMGPGASVRHIQTLIKKQTLSSARNPGADAEYVVSEDSNVKDDTDNAEYDFPAPPIAGFEPAQKTARQDSVDDGDFSEKVDELYEEYKEAYEEEHHREYPVSREDFPKKFNLKFGSRFNPDSEEADDDDNTEKIGWLEFDYKRLKYKVEFWEKDGTQSMISEELPYETNLSAEGYTGKVKPVPGSGQFPDTYTFMGKTFTRPAYLPKDYVFVGWARDRAGTQLIEGGDGPGVTLPLNGIKLYAAWARAKAKHTVTFDYNMPQTDAHGKEIPGTSVTKKQVVEHRTKLDKTKLTVPTRPGYDFYGWEITRTLTEPDGSTVVKSLPYAFGNGVVEDITLKAVWIKDTRYTGTVRHVFLKPGATIKDYESAPDDAARSKLVEIVRDQSLSGLREHLTYAAEASYRDSRHFPDVNYQSFEVSSNPSKNTATFVYQTYNTRSYTVQYLDAANPSHRLLADKTVQSVNRKYDVASYAQIDGYKPRSLQQTIIYSTDSEGKQTADVVIKFMYDDVRVLRRADRAQKTPDGYTRYIFRVADGNADSGFVSDWQGSVVPDGEELVYDVIHGTKAYELPLPKKPQAKPGFVFYKWKSKLSVSDGRGGMHHVDGPDRLPVLSESQSVAEVVYTAHFNLKTPLPVSGTVFRPGQKLGAGEEGAKALIQNFAEYPAGAHFSYAPREEFDPRPGLHKITVQVTLGGEVTQTQVEYTVLPQMVFNTYWDAYKDKYGSEYVPLTFTSKTDEGTIVGGDRPYKNGDSDAITAWVYKGADQRIRVPLAFGKDHSDKNYNYVFKGWKLVSPDGQVPGGQGDSAPDISPEAGYYDLKNPQAGLTYQAVYRKIDYVSGHSDSGDIPKDAVVAVFKPAPGRQWDDGTTGPKVFYVRKGTNIRDIKDAAGRSVLDKLAASLTGVTGWSRSSMLNDGIKVDPIDDMSSASWVVKEPFQEFVAIQTKNVVPITKSSMEFAIRKDDSTLPAPEKFIENYDLLRTDPNVDSVRVEYVGSLKTEKEGTYSVPLKVTVKYKDVKKPVEYESIGVLKVLYDLLYGEKTEKDPHTGELNLNNPEMKKIHDLYARVTFADAAPDADSPQGKGKIDGRKEFYAYRSKASGVKAPKATGRDYDALGYHYTFKGWHIVGSPDSEILSDADVYRKTYPQDTVYEAVYTRMENIIDPSKVDEIPAGYTAVIFTPASGRLWADGTDKPKLRYIRHGANPADNVAFAKLTAERLGRTLSGFTGWKMYDPKDKEFDLADSKSWDWDKPRILVARQTPLPQLRMREVVIGVGDEMPDLQDLVANLPELANNPTVTVEKAETEDGVPVNGSSARPGVTIVTLTLSYQGDRAGKPAGAHADLSDTPNFERIRVRVPVRVRVLPNVIAGQDLPAAGTPEADFVAQNYTKVTYVAGEHGRMLSPVFTYWVRKNTQVQLALPQIAADKGYLFKDWTSRTNPVPQDPGLRGVASAEQREALAHRAEIAGKPFVAKLIRSSKQSTLSALRALLENAGVHQETQYETVITANFEKMKPARFVFSATACEGANAYFTLADGYGKAVFAPGGPASVFGLRTSCETGKCAIAGVPRITDWASGERSRIVPMMFMTVDEYGRETELRVDVEILRRRDAASPYVPSPYSPPAVRPHNPPASPAAAYATPAVNPAVPERLPRTGGHADLGFWAAALTALGLAGRRRKKEE